jgi:hypothetical protein
VHGSPGPETHTFAWLLLTLLMCGGAQTLHAQADPPPPPGSPPVAVVPGATYGASSLYQGLMGAGFRELWTTPIVVPVANLDSIGGGVEPVRLGGGVSTKTLHLDGADGRRYVFRSVNKTPSELLDDFAGSALEGIIQDQMSSFHPTGAPIVARLLDELDVLHPDPSFMVVPDDPRLGEFHDDFAGLLVLVEERPDDGPDGGPGFAASRRIVQTDDLLEILEEGPEHTLVADELLRSRLVDLLVGDRDRSHNNHLWARFDRPGGGFIWRVIPRDRDQAFVRFDGALLSVARRYERRFVTFTEAYPDIEGLTRNAWDIDRNLLVSLSRDDWDRIVQDVVERLDDDVIADAVDQMPLEHAALIGETLRQALSTRRDHLPEAASELYRIVFTYADIHVTDVAERLEVDRRQDGEVSVTITALGAEETFRRTFDPSETSEVRIYLHGGPDEAILTGNGRDGILVRIVGGGGVDRFVDRSTGSHRRTILYDPGSATEFPESSDARIQRRAAPRPFAWWFDTDRTLDWGTLTIPQPEMSYDEDRGLVVVAGLKHDRYAFLKRPYGARIQLEAGWAFAAQEPILGYRHLVRDAVGGMDVRLRLEWSGIELINFYGFGNETQAAGTSEFHRITHKEITGGFALGVGDGDRSYLELGPTFKRTSADTALVTSFLADRDPYGAGRFSQAGIEVAFAIDRRDLLGTPTEGLRLEGGASYFPEWLDVTRGAFGEVHGQMAAYVSPPWGNPVLALRVAGQRVWGTYPFAEAAFLGGPNSLRGLREQRYAGDAMVLGSAELRIELFRMLFPLPTDVGVLALSDIGRVILDGETSDKWHSGYGGGLWFALVNRANVVRIVMARSAGRNRIQAGVGFAY